MAREVSLEDIDVFDVFDDAFRDTDVGIVEFCESEDFCQKPLFPRQRVLLKLIWLEEMEGWEEDVLDEWIRGDDPDIMICSQVRERRQKLIDEGYDHFSEIMLIGGRRSSKGHVTGLSVAKKLYDTVMLKNPQEVLGVDKDKQIYFTSIAASLDQAKQYQFADIVGSILSCKALEPYVDRVLEEVFAVQTPADQQRANRFSGRKAKIERNLASIIGKPMAANAGTVRGQAALCVVMDEMAFMLEGINSKSSAKKIYDAIKPTLDQFGKNSLFFQNSSPYTEIGQFYDNYKQFMPLDKSGNLNSDKVIDYRTLAFQFPSWALYQGWERDRRFKNAIVLPPNKSEEMRLEEEKNPEVFRVERRSHFTKVLSNFIDPDKVDEMFDLPWQGKKLMTKTSRAGFGPEVEFKGHADPATTTANFGLAIAHIEYGEDRDGHITPHVIFDYIHAWVPSHYEDNTINYLEVEDDILKIISAFRPREFSFDQYNSRLIIDSLKRKVYTKGIGDVKILEKTATVSSNQAKAQAMKTAVNLNLVHAPDDSPGARILRNEMKFLQETNGKVDKQKVGPVTTKDVFDCAAECVYYLMNDYLHTDLGEVPVVLGRGFGGGPGRGSRSVLDGGVSSPNEVFAGRQRNQYRNPARGAIGRRRF